jgi:hypothetical protein
MLVEPSIRESVTAGVFAWPDDVLYEGRVAAADLPERPSSGQLLDDLCLEFGASGVVYSRGDLVGLGGG